MFTLSVRLLTLDVRICLWVVKANINIFHEVGGRGAGAKAVCLESRGSRVQTPLWPLSFKEAQMFLPRSLLKK